MPLNRRTYFGYGDYSYHSIYGDFSNMIKIADNTTKLNRTYYQGKVIGYKNGNPLQLYLNYYPHLSGCTPYQWDTIPCDFATKEQVKDYAKHAACSYLVDRVDLSTLVVTRFDVETISTVVTSIV